MGKGDGGAQELGDPFVFGSFRANVRRERMHPVPEQAEERHGRFPEGGGGKPRQDRKQGIARPAFYLGDEDPLALEARSGCRLSVPLEVGELRVVLHRCSCDLAGRENHNPTADCPLGPSAMLHFEVEFTLRNDQTMVGCLDNLDLECLTPVRGHISPGQAGPYGRSDYRRPAITACLEAATSCNIAYLAQATYDSTGFALGACRRKAFRKAFTGADVAPCPADFVIPRIVQVRSFLPR